MPQKIHKFNINKKYSQVKCDCNNDPQWKLRRPVVSSEECIKTVPHQRSWLKLVNRAGHEEPYRDFTSYYRSSNRANEPTYSLISHATRPNDKPKPTICTYPMEQSLRWNPHVETTPIPTALTVDVGVEPHACHCVKCISKRCPSKVSMKTGFKDNIMRFCDQSTNTPKVLDAGIGSCSISRTSVSDMLAGPSEIVYKDNCVQFEQAQNAHVKLNTSPININRRTMKTCPKQNYNNLEDAWSSGASDVEENYNRGYRKDDFNEMPQRDNQPVKIGGKINIRKNWNNSHSSTHNIRKVLYNEGSSKGNKSKGNKTMTNTNHSKTITKRYRDLTEVERERNDERIPFSHRNDSRYHANCRKSQNRLYIVDSDELRQLVESPKLLKKTCMSKPVTYYKIPTVKLPKRVLTSERNIGSVNR